jgi:hypothetical protein
MSIRTDVHEVGDALAAIGLSLVDGDKETATEYFNMLFNLGKESADIVKVSKEERFKAIEHAFAYALGQVAEKGITYSDEKV